MRFNVRSFIVGIASCSVLLLGSNLAVAQTTPAPNSTSTDFSSDRVVGRVNPEQSIDVMVRNNTSSILYVGFSGGSHIQLEPNDDTTVSFDEAPINLFIYASGENLETEYRTTIAGNTICVEVIPKADQISPSPGTPPIPGDNALNINPSGTVYIY